MIDRRQVLGTLVLSVSAVMLRLQQRQLPAPRMQPIDLDTTESRIFLLDERERVLAEGRADPAADGRARVVLAVQATGVARYLVVTHPRYGVLSRSEVSVFDGHPDDHFEGCHMSSTTLCINDEVQLDVSLRV